MDYKIKTFEDACKATGTEFNPPKGLSKDVIAYMKLCIIAKALNEDWKPDWHNHDERKYYPWFWMGDPGEKGSVGFSCSGYDYVSTGSAVGSRLCFKSRGLAIYAGEQFTEIYKEFYLI